MVNSIKTIEGESNTNRTDINPVEIPVGVEQVQNTTRVEQEPDSKTSNESNIQKVAGNAEVKSNYAEIMRDTLPDKGGLPNIKSTLWLSNTIEKAGGINNISTGYGSKNYPFSA